MIKFMTSTWLILLLCVSTYGQTFDSGSTGADGPFNPPSQVPAGTQVQGDCTRAPGCTVIVPLREPSNHIFNFTSVTIGPFVTVGFRRNAANTPVFILAQGDVTINGTIDVSGQNAARGMLGAAQGGPGGFSGGVAGVQGSPTRVGGAGGGPGGGAGGGPVTIYEPYQVGAGGGFGSPGRTYRSYIEPGAVYGIPELLPLIGGSGGGGGATSGAVPNGNGGGGGGALLIASSRVIDLGAGGGYAISAIGGNGEPGVSVYEGASGGGGSGGAIRLVAPVLRGRRELRAQGGSGGWDENPGGVGRIRFEAFSIQYTGAANPQPAFGLPGPILPPVAPALRIVSIAGVSVPRQPTSDIVTPDVTLPANFTNPVRIELEATNVPSGTRTRVIAAPQIGSGQRVIAQPVELTGPAGQPKRGMATLNLPARGVGIISAVIDAVVPEP